MKFFELMERARARGVAVVEIGGMDVEVGAVCEDSRKVKPGDLFVARGGTKISGARFAVDAVARGAVGVVGGVGWGGGGEEKLELPGNVAWARVDDANMAAGILAHEMAGNPTAGMTMIGVTGTKGKTTVAYLLRSVLQGAGKKVGMIGTVEIDDGKEVLPAEMTTPGGVELVELFSRMKRNGVTHCVMEVSSHALHQRRVAGIDFAVAIFTNLTGDHLDYHKTMEEYAAAKALLFEGLSAEGIAVINADDAWGGRMVQGCKAKYGLRYQLWPEGRAGRAWGDMVGRITQMTSESMTLEISVINGSKFELKTHLVGQHNAYNLMSAMMAACFNPLNVPVEVMLKSLREARGAPGRLQRVEAGDVSVFVDYAHTHDALENVLRALRATMVAGHESADVESDSMSLCREHAQGPCPEHGTQRTQRKARLICVFGCGGDRDRTKRPKMGAVAERLADAVIVTSDNPRTEEPGAIIDEICAGFSAGWRESGRIWVEADRREAIRAAIGMAKTGDVVVIAGKGHENYQIIGTTKHHFDDVEEAEMALRETLASHEDTKARRII